MRTSDAKKRLQSLLKASTHFKGRRKQKPILRLTPAPASFHKIRISTASTPAWDTGCRFFLQPTFAFPCTVQFRKAVSLCKLERLSDHSHSCELSNKDQPMPLTEEEYEELEESFRYNDANNDGRLGFTEFVAMLDALEAGMSPDEVRVGFEEIDTDKDGSIELDEFIDWWRDS
jgi:hypothetical protein